MYHCFCEWMLVREWMKMWLGVYAEDGNVYEVQKDVEKVEGVSVRQGE